MGASHVARKLVHILYAVLARATVHAAPGARGRRQAVSSHLTSLSSSSYATLERELADGADWATRDAARTAVLAYVETWYNRRRRHSALRYVTPEQYEQKLLASAA